MSLIDPEFEINPWPYIGQISIAGMFMMFIFAAFDLYTETALIAALASSAFIAYTVPNSHATDLRPMIGGYAVGMGVGIVFSLMHSNPYLANGLESGMNSMLNLIGLSASPRSTLAFFAFLSFMSSAFIMAATDTEHAPAVAIAVGLIINRWDLSTLLFIFIGILFLALSKKAFEKWMVDLI